MTVFSNQTALITGASRGIGRAAAERFAQAGYSLILTCQNSIEALRALAQELQGKYKISCRAFQTDMGSEEEVQTLFSQISDLDVLINNAGIAHIGLLHQMTSAEWHRILAVNLDSCFYTCRAAIPLMLKKHSGSVVNVSSIWGVQGASMEVAYSASKGGMNSFTKALAKELAPSGIAVNAVCCGVIDTDMNRCLSSDDLEALCQEIPADRLGKPEEAAELIFQTARAPSYMTGQLITIAGGLD